MAKQHYKLTKLELLLRIVFITIGAALVSVALEIFLVPNNIIDGGVVGISIIIVPFDRLAARFVSFLA